MSEEKTQWPVKLMLAHPRAEFLQTEEVKIVADCGTLSKGKFSEEFSEGEATLIGCPMLSNPKKLEQKMSLLLNQGSIEKVSIYSMEVPCCHALHKFADKVNKSDVDIDNYIIRVEEGKIEEYGGNIDRSMCRREKEAHGGGK